MAKILLVEDDPLMVRMYQRKLISDSYDVGVAVNGEEGLAKVRSFRPDLVLLDIMMPKLNGLEVLERMKSDPTTSKIPVIILTNLGGSQDDIDNGLELGAVAYLIKSAYRPDEVVKKVKEVLAGYTRSKEIPEAAVSEAPQEVLRETERVSIRGKKKTEEEGEPATPQEAPKRTTVKLTIVKDKNKGKTKK